MDKIKYRIHGLEVELFFQDKKSRLLLEPALRDLSLLACAKSGGRGKKIKLYVKSGKTSGEKGFKKVMGSSRNNTLAWRKNEDFIFTDAGHSFRVGRDGKANLNLGGSGKNGSAIKQVLAAGLTCILRANGFFPLHACGVTGRGKKILICGGSGSGKSTLTLSLILSGYKFLSDDLLFLRQNRRRVQALAGETYLTFNPGLFGGKATAAGKERTVDIASVFGRRCLPSFFPDKILFPHIGKDKRSRIKRIPGRLALFRLLNQSVSFMLGGSPAQKNLDLLSRLCRQTAGYQLSLGRDLYRDPRKINALVARI